MGQGVSRSDSSSDTIVFVFIDTTPSQSVLSDPSSVCSCPLTQMLIMWYYTT